jgi:LysR family glycine cleavage system transcriptional activator
LLAFEAAARHGSITKAAEEQHLTQSALSRQILHLESRLGVALFQRVRQRVILTDAGRLYAAEVRQVLEELGNATHRAMAFVGMSSVVNLAVLPTLGTRWLVPRLPHFMALHPEATINLTTRSEPFDFALEPVDGAIHFGEPFWPGAVCIPLMTEDVVPVCSPEFQATRSIRTCEDLAQCRLMHKSTRPMLWAEWFEQAGVDAPFALRGASFGQFAMLAQGAAAGMGVALLPTFLIEEELATGKLEVLFDIPLKSKKAYYLVLPESKAITPLVDHFKQWLLEEAGKRSV